jgi:stress-induced morphogen
MPILKQDLEATIKAALPDAEIQSHDSAGDNDHWAVEVKSAAFAGLSRMAQHKLIQNAVKDKNIHSLQIKTIAV